MPLLIPPFVPTVFTAECNSPAPIGGGGQVQITWDKLYDVNSVEIVSPPAASGLTTDGVSFTATVAGLFGFWAGVDVVAVPGHAGSIAIATPDYGESPSFAISSPNAIGSGHIGRPVWLHVGDTVVVVASGTSGDTLISYGTLTIVRLS